VLQMNCEKIKSKVGIRAVLESFQLFPVKDNTKTAFYFALDRDERTASLSVDFIKNTAFDFGTGRSYDVISIVQVINKCSVAEALKYLSAFDFTSEMSNRNELTAKVPNYEIVRIGIIEHPALIQYLQERKVYEQRHLVKEVHYILNGKKYFGVGFENNSGGFEIRNRYSKICLGTKDIALIENKRKVKNELVIFEGFFDYLSYRMYEKGTFFSDILILNSTSMFFKIEKKLHEYEKLFLFLDNDINGRSLASTIKEQHENVENCSISYTDFKDLNEWHCCPARNIHKNDKF